MEDIIGNKVLEGDVLLEIGRGSGFDGEKHFFSLKLSEMPKSFNGHGYAYSIDETKHLWAWASLDNSYKINFADFPPEFRYSFYHGMSDLNTSLKKGNQLELISNSNWEDKIITKKVVDHYNKLESIKIDSIEDIQNNI